MPQPRSPLSLSTWNELAQLAPPDLTQPGFVESRFTDWKLSAAGWTLHYATQRLNPAILDQLARLADELDLVGQYRAMMGGAVMNRIEGVDCENRQVLHTAMRDVFPELSRPDSPSEPAAQAAAQEELLKLKTFCDDLDAGRLLNAQGESFREMILVGIGGSDLGPRAIYLALKAFGRKDRKVHFISNVDPDDAAAVLAEAELPRTLVCIISKSGTTLETLTNELLVASAFTRAGLEPARHFLCVTGKGSPMDNPSRYLKSFYMFDYIGGRYSVSSMVGAVMLAFGLGYHHFMDFLRGTRRMDVNALERDVRKNMPLLMALIGVWNRNFLGCHTLAVLPYSQALSRFAAHLQQCDMESNGKRVDRQGQAITYPTGPILWGEPGTNGQHAFYQLIHQSETVVPCDFIGLRQSQYGQDIEVKGTTSQQKLLANLLAQSLGLATGRKSDNCNRHFPGNRPNSLLMAERLTPETMGALLALYENKIAFQGFIWNINSFDQEGVQLGKVMANTIIDAMKEWPAQTGPAHAYMQSAQIK